jgi:hypothetical protein
VPLKVRVCDWTLPDGAEYVTWMDMAESPETLAMVYKVPLWSEKHWEFIARSFDLLRTVGNKTVYVPLIATTHLGNAETMVRWKKKADGGYEYDFGVMDKYLDVCEKHMGRPALVVLYAYDFFLGTSGSAHQGGDSAVIGAIKHDKDEPVPVTAVGAAAGADALHVPSYGDGEAEKAWGPMAAELMKRLKARGLEKRVALGMSGDLCVPRKYAELWEKVLPGVPWVVHSHNPMHFGAKLYDKYPVAYNAAANLMRYAIDPGVRRDYGWNREIQGATSSDPRGRKGYLDRGGKGEVAIFPRYMGSPDRALVRTCAEYQIAGWQIGVGRLMADFFPCLGSHCLVLRYPRGWHNMSITKVRNWLAPGPEGAETTMGFEMLREGVQECEARIFVEKALLDAKSRARLGDSLAARSQEVLDRRLRYMMWMFRQGDFSLQASSRTLLLGNDPGARTWGGSMPLAWYAGSDWRGRSEELFATAGEVEKALGSR